MASQQAMDNYLDLIAMRHAVRYGEQPDSPHLIQRWLVLEELVFPHSCNCVRRRVYRREYDLLLEAIADELVPESWRQLCMDYSHHPLNGLSSIATKPHQRRSVNRLQWQLRTIASYSLEYSAG